MAVQGEVFPAADQPGGGREQPENDSTPPQQLQQWTMQATCENYRERAFANGIAVRPNG